MKLSALCRLAASSLCAAAACLAASCSGTTRDGEISASPPPANVRTRLRSPVAVLYSGLNSGVSVRIPRTGGEIMRDAAAPGQSIGRVVEGDEWKGGDMGTALAMIPFIVTGGVLQGLAVGPLSPAFAAAGTPEKEAFEKIARVQKKISGTRWDSVVKSAVSTRWRAAGGGAFERTAVLAEAHFDAKRNPGTLAGLAAAGSRTVLDLLVSGPCLTSPGGSALSPCTTIWFRVVDAKSGAVLHRGSVRATSKESRSLASWASDDGVLLCRELEASAQRAAAELADVLLRK